MREAAALRPIPVVESVAFICDDPDRHWTPRPLLLDRLVPQSVHELRHNLHRSLTTRNVRQVSGDDPAVDTHPELRFDKERIGHLRLGFGAQRMIAPARSALLRQLVHPQRMRLRHEHLGAAQIRRVVWVQSGRRRRLLIERCGQICGFLFFSFACAQESPREMRHSFVGAPELRLSSLDDLAPRQFLEERSELLGGGLVVELEHRDACVEGCRCSKLYSVTILRRQPHEGVVGCRQVVEAVADEPLDQARLARARRTK